MTIPRLAGLASGTPCPWPCGPSLAAGVSEGGLGAAVSYGTGGTPCPARFAAYFPAAVGEESESSCSETFLDIEIFDRVRFGENCLRIFPKP